MDGPQPLLQGQQLEGGALEGGLGRGDRAHRCHTRILPGASPYNYGECTVNLYYSQWMLSSLSSMPRESGNPRRRRKHTTTGGLTRETAYLYGDEEAALETSAQKERCSKSEIIRRALREYLKLRG